MYPGLLYSEVNTILTIDAIRTSTDEDFAIGRAEEGVRLRTPESAGQERKPRLTVR